MESEHSTDLQALTGVAPTGTAMGSAGRVHRLEGPTDQGLPLSHPRGVQDWEWAEDTFAERNPEKAGNAFLCLMSDRTIRYL